MVPTGAIAWEAVQRFSELHEVGGVTVMVVAAIGIVVNGVSAWLRLAGCKGGLNIRGAFLHALQLVTLRCKSRQAMGSASLRQSTSCRAGRMDHLTLFGLFSLSVMMVTYAFDDRSHWFTLAFAGTCLLASAYGFL